ncbi:MAG: DUF4405 domain-containing protein [Sedimenticola sp.]|nr:DUF4405 domain-containing protein [Sedimenticola sp.]
MASQINQQLQHWLPRRLATPVTATLALVVSISGVMMFFHLGEGAVKTAHEWLGMAFVLFMLVHLLSNWGALSNHFRQGVARSGAAAVILATGLFLGSSASSESGGPELVYRALQEAPVASVAALFQVDETSLRDVLAERGIATDSARQSLSDAATKAGLSKREAVKQLVAGVDRLR